jgi:hypothetical protein
MKGTPFYRIARPATGKSGFLLEASVDEPDIWLTLSKSLYVFFELSRFKI